MLTALVLAALALQTASDVRTWTIEFGDWTCACESCAANLERTLRAIPNVDRADVSVADAARGLGTATLAQRESGALRLDLLTNALRPQTAREIRVTLRAWGQSDGDMLVLSARWSGEVVRILRPRDAGEQRAFNAALSGIAAGPAKVEATVRFPAPDFAPRVAALSRSDWPDPARR